MSGVQTPTPTYNNAFSYQLSYSNGTKEGNAQYNDTYYKIESKICVP